MDFHKRILFRQSVIILLVSVVFISFISDKKRLVILSTPAGNMYTKIDRNGTTVIPNGRLLTPAGVSIEVAPHPYGLAISNDGSIAVTANSGVAPISISIIKNLSTSKPTVIQIPQGAKTDKGILASVYMGIVISNDNKLIYVSGGQEDKIYVFSVEDGSKKDSIDCSKSLDGMSYTDGYIGDMVMDKNSKFLYALDQTNFRMMIIDVASKSVVANAPTGRYPFGIAISPDQEKVFVANVGMFEYKKIGDIENQKDHENALDFPPFGFNTKEMREGTRIDSLTIPGLGDPNVPESFSVWTVSVKDPGHPQVISKIKTGTLVGEKVEGVPAIGGSSPNSLVATSKYVFVSNGNDDNISVIDITNDKVIKEIYLKPDSSVSHFKGVIPFGLAVSPDGKRLYAAEAGINAIAVIDIPELKVLGHIPTGWFPAKVKVTGDGRKIIVTNAKGYGSGPNGGDNFKQGPEGTYIGHLMKGTVSVIDVPSDTVLEDLTKTVIRNNFKIEYADDKKIERGNNPIPLYGGERVSPIKHIVFISKENRTYDEVFGQVEKGDGDPKLARYGKNVSFMNRNKTSVVDNTNVMPNHLKLASEFSIADNFYVDSDVSADGHRWLANTYPNEWVEVNSPASYGGNREYNKNSLAPGMLGFTGSAGAVYPEDYNEGGTMWDHFARNKIDFFNFGFGTMFEPAIYGDKFKYSGIKYFVNYPVPEPLFEKTSRMYPTFNTAIPDQFRISQFIKEFNEKWGGEDKILPPVLTVIIPNDHGAQERPEAGYPFRESYMADNDLAVGRIVEFLSHSKYWKDMMIVIVEDDAQNGVDHIDAHRSVLMVISPYVKRNYVGKTHYSFGSIFKTFWNVLGLPYLNQYDASATDLSDMFTETLDITPYTAVSVDSRIFDPQTALTPLDEKFDWKAFDDSREMDNINDVQKDQKEKEEDRIEDQKK